MSTQEQTTISTGTGPVDDSLQAGDLWDTLRQLTELRSFTEMVEKAGVIPQLREPNIRTIFAPTNAAVEAAIGAAGVTDPETVVSLHIVVGRQTEADLKSTDSVRTLGGVRIPVEYHSEGSRFGDAKIIRRDIAARNGAIQIIDRVVTAPAGGDSAG